jgi:hypothetical protein
MNLVPEDTFWRAVAQRSLQIEVEQGWDSLETMATNYPTDERTKAIICPFPKCGFRRHDPRSMFKHVHFGPHGLTYGLTLHDFAEGDRHE